jgi:hypothetical protein
MLRWVSRTVLDWQCFLMPLAASCTSDEIENVAANVNAFEI